MGCMFTFQTPYFMALTACKMVLRAASEDLQHLLLCASEYDQSPFFFFFFFHFSLLLFSSGVQQYRAGTRKRSGFPQKWPGLYVQSNTTKGSFHTAKADRRDPNNNKRYLRPFCNGDCQVVKFLTSLCCCPSRNLQWFLFDFPAAKHLAPPYWLSKRACMTRWSSGPAR